MARTRGMRDMAQRMESEDKDDTVDVFVFSAPRGFEAPSDIDEGDAFDVSARVYFNKDGKVVLERINGIPLSEQEVEDDEEEVEDDEESEQVAEADLGQAMNAYMGIS